MCNIRPNESATLSRTVSGHTIKLDPNMLAKHKVREHTTMAVGSDLRVRESYTRDIGEITRSVGTAESFLLMEMSTKEKLRKLMA